MAKTVTPSAEVITRRVKVDRTKTPQDVLDGTGRTQSINPEVVDNMPCGEGEEVEVHFFKVGSPGVDVEYDFKHEYEIRGLKPADPYSLAQANADDPTFGDEHPNITYWKDIRDEWCYATFYKRGSPFVCVDFYDYFYGCWWFAGIRK